MAKWNVLRLIYSNVIFLWCRGRDNKAKFSSICGVQPISVTQWRWFWLIETKTATALELHEIFAMLMCTYFATLKFRILRNCYILNHFNLAVLSLTQFTIHWQYYLACPWIKTTFSKEQKRRHEKRNIGTKKGLEILVEATVGMVTTSKNLDVIEGFKQRVEQHYREPKRTVWRLHKRSAARLGDWKQ